LKWSAPGAPGALMLGHMTDSTIDTSIGLRPGALPARLGSELERQAAAGPRWIARTPGSLDVMWAAVAQRDDRTLRIYCEGPNRREAVRVDWPLADFYSGDVLAEADDMQQRCERLECARARAVVCAAYVLLETGLVRHFGGGLTVLVESEIPGEVDCREVAAVQAGVIAGLARACNAAVDRQKVACLAQRGEHLVAGFASGIATHAAPLLGVPGELLQICCQPFEVSGSLGTPKDVTVIGIDCGARHPKADDKYAQARVTALMGREIIRRIVEMSDGDAGRWNGYLARCSVTDYVDRFRDRLPTKLKGAVYLEHFGPLNEPMAEIDPAGVYKIRSRAEHHIYENDRVRQFAERLARAARTGEPSATAEAGELMYASHWSYGQRCGLGSIETDLLVNLLRAEGADRGIFGARISGSGAGGTVVALIHDTEETQAAVRRATETYQQRTGNVAFLLPAAPRGVSGFSVEQAD
jgi:galactokinase